MSQKSFNSFIRKIQSKNPVKYSHSVKSDRCEALRDTRVSMVRVWFTRIRIGRVHWRCSCASSGACDCPRKLQLLRLTGQPWRVTGVEESNVWLIPDMLANISCKLWSVPDLHTEVLDASRSTQSNFLHFHAVSVKFGQIIGWHPLLWIWCPPSGKSWIHCSGIWLDVRQGSGSLESDNDYLSCLLHQMHPLSAHLGTQFKIITV